MRKINEGRAKSKKKDWGIDSFSSLIGWALVIGIVLTALFLIPHCLGFFGQESTAKGGAIIVEYQVFYYYLSLAFTLLLISIAYIQLKGVKKNIRAKFLLEIDWRWGNRENLEARKIIHKMLRDAEIRHGKLSDETREKITSDIGEQILALRESHKEFDCEQFIYLLNFIDFMETIGYLHKSEYVDLKDLEELCGHSLKFNYEIFKKYIDNRNERHGNFYEYFTELYEMISKFHD